MYFVHEGFRGILKPVLKFLEAMEKHDSSVASFVKQSTGDENSIT